MTKRTRCARAPYSNTRLHARETTLTGEPTTGESIERHVVGMDSGTKESANAHRQACASRMTCHARSDVGKKQHERKETLPLHNHNTHHTRLLGTRLGGPHSCIAQDASSCPPQPPRSVVFSRLFPSATQNNFRDRVRDSWGSIFLSVPNIDFRKFFLGVFLGVGISNSHNSFVKAHQRKL